MTEKADGIVVTVKLCEINDKISMLGKITVCLPRQEVQEIVNNRRARPGWSAAINDSKNRAVVYNANNVFQEEFSSPIIEKEVFGFENLSSSEMWDRLCNVFDIVQDALNDPKAY